MILTESKRLTQDWVPYLLKAGMSGTAYSSGAIYCDFLAGIEYYAGAELPPCYLDRPEELYWGGAFDTTFDGGTRILDPLALVPALVAGYAATNCFEVIVKTAEAVNPSTSALIPGRPSAHLSALDWIKDVTGFSDKRLARLVGITRQSIDRWRHGEAVADANRRRVLIVKEVLERALDRFKMPNDLVAWLDTPRGADGRTPAELLEANEIGRARLLAVSAPSPRLKRAPPWTNRPVPEAFRAGAERRQKAVPPDQDDELLAAFGEPGGEDREELEAPGV